VQPASSGKGLTCCRSPMLLVTGYRSAVPATSQSLHSHPIKARRPIRPTGTSLPTRAIWALQDLRDRLVLLYRSGLMEHFLQRSGARSFGIRLEPLARSSGLGLTAEPVRRLQPHRLLCVESAVSKFWSLAYRQAVAAVMRRHWRSETIPTSLATRWQASQT